MKSDKITRLPPELEAQFSPELRLVREFYFQNTTVKKDNEVKENESYENSLQD